MDITAIRSDAVTYMVIALVVSIVLPVVLGIFYRKKNHAEGLFFFAGAGFYLFYGVFVYQLFHTVIFHLAEGAMNRNFWLSLLVEALLIAILEEMARVTVFGLVLKERRSGKNAYMYGAGHCFVYGIVTTAVTMVSNLMLVMAINSGVAQSAINNAKAEEAAQMIEELTEFSKLSPSVFLAEGIQCLLWIFLQLCFTLMIYKVFEEGKKAGKIAVVMGIHFLAVYSVSMADHYLSPGLATFFLFLWLVVIISIVFAASIRQFFKDGGIKAYQERREEEKRQEELKKHKPFPDFKGKLK